MSRTAKERVAAIATTDCPCQAIAIVALEEIERLEQKILHPENGGYLQGYKDGCAAASARVERIPPEDHRLLAEYLAGREINGETIGDIRRSLFHPFECPWNSVVRDMTADLERGARRASNGIASEPPWWPDAPVVDKGWPDGVERERDYDPPLCDCRLQCLSRDRDNMGTTIQTCRFTVGKLDTGSASNVLLPETREAAKREATAFLRELKWIDFEKAVRKLIDQARTTGGTAGRDEGLCAALDAVEALLPPITP